MAVLDKLSMMVPIAECRDCKERLWLINEQMYLPEDVPAKFASESSTFVCCHTMQYVLGTDIRFLPVSVTAVPTPTSPPWKAVSEL
jgi:hypothetical protein